ncbi:hypothetical protein CTI14_68095, partial [Methylobacterium radiotolerans]
MDPAERKKQYDAGITYGTNNEFGFDYLRDNMARVPLPRHLERLHPWPTWTRPSARSSTTPASPTARTTSSASTTSAT